MLDLKQISNKYNLKVKDISHVGAHDAKEVKKYKALFPDSKIHLFEPNNESFKKLNKKFQMNFDIFLYNIALGSENSKKVLNISSQFPSTSSILEPFLHTQYYPEIKFDKKEIIKEVRYDSLNIQNVNYISIDTQGYEMEVLKGFGSKLNEIDYINIEINRKPMYKGCPLVKDIDKFLSNQGYIRLVTMFYGKECVWGDGLYFKKILLSKKNIFITHFKNYLYRNILIYKYLRFLKVNKKKFIKILKVKN